MKLQLIRKYLKPSYTIGNLFIDDVFVCDTLEDTVRDLSIEPKIPGETAIPYGTYKVVLNYSEKFNMILPLLQDVPQFKGVRMHAGNTHKDTEGCILVGKNNVVGALTNSRNCLKFIIERLSEEPDDIAIEIC